VGLLKVLLIEDRPSAADLVREMLGGDEGLSYELIHVPRLSEGLEQLSAGDLDVILLDLHLPDSQGLETFRRTAARAPGVAIVVLSSLDDRAIAVEAVSQGAQDYLVKGRVEAERLKRVLRHAVERKAIEKTLRRQKAELIARNRDLDTFADTVAHDLKTPISLMLGFTSYLQSHLDTLSDQEIRTLLGKVLKSCCKMETILDGLMVLSSVRRSDVELQPLDMEAVVREALDRLAPMIEGAGAEVILPDTWPVARGYAPWVEEVWVNYLSNALKYGGESPKITLGGAMDSDGMVRFWVRDEGEGIPPELRSGLFRPLDNETCDYRKGHGLGLSIVQRIVDRLGGQVGVESSMGRGSTFYFMLPARG
jgi:signal transduction histidine kinase